MAMSQHKWPLPAGELDARSVVFELAIPPYSKAWRDATCFIIYDLLQSQYSGGREGEYKVRMRTHLSSYYDDNSGNQGRIEFVSTTAPNLEIHISTAEEGDVSAPNGRTYKYYDTAKNRYVSSFVATKKIPEACMYKLSESNAGLQQFMFRPPENSSGPPPNHVLSQQFCCPRGLTLEAFKAMATLPLEYRLQ
ncbi:hypothetical protein GGS23DRAFT_116456 [Durotheca rogersii]|uniref:uncharacterized protein n=1 Tax=Durotheca rogersii TaxID=419775 RepID=UPI0022201A6F|nr:uncharacterized protein GGS23DRAFT_116456 [Durotheca rogersii]KAI5862289.1 hypothetical protein GGS23DRAFT_116456 [Durotheca rogersii]